MHNEQANFPSDFDLSGFLAQPQTSVNNGGANNIAGSSSGGHEAGSSQLDLQLDNNQRARRPLQHLQARPDSLMSSVEQRSEDRPMMGLQQQTVPNAGNQVNLDALQQLLSMQMDSSNAQMQLQQHQHQQHGGPPNTMATSAQSLLEQQVRLNQLQQLQQLQNQIFQQQIELISGQTNMNSTIVENMHGSFRDPTSFHGLPTPANSTEIRAQPSSNFVSPMILQNYAGHSATTSLTQFSSPNPMPQGPSSAPAHIAFSHNQPSLPSPAELDFDLEPLTSPWLGAYQGTEHSQAHASPDITSSRSTAQKKSGTKRTAPNSEEDISASQARKRHSPAVCATAGRPMRHAASRASGSTSLTSTPALRSRSRNNSTAEDPVADTPSPVDLSVSSSIAMPPPAPPAMQSQPVGSNQAHNPTLSPVTPASIMNLGRIGLGSGLSPPLNGNPSTGRDAGGSGASSSGKTKAAPKPKASSSGAGSSKSSKKASSNASMISPSLKPILPGGLAPASAAHLALHPNYTHHLAGSAPALNISPSTPLPQPTLQVRKTSHKAAEQKRRDSLKTSFDDLRLLLPPIPLPTDDNYDGSPPLPGAMPPRGPPRAEIQGPNRAVSKLQLLRCGNDYIRQLLRMVGRRDDYIEGMKTEIKALRALVSEDADKVDKLKEIEMTDLEYEIDAIEANGPRLGGIMEGDEGDEEGDE